MQFFGETLKLNKSLYHLENLEPSNYTYYHDIYRQPIHRYYAVAIVRREPGPVGIRYQQRATYSWRSCHQWQWNWHTLQPLWTCYEYTAISIDVYVLSKGIAQREVLPRQVSIRPDPVQVFPLKSDLKSSSSRALKGPKDQGEA